MTSFVRHTPIIDGRFFMQHFEPRGAILDSTLLDSNTSNIEGRILMIQFKDVRSFMFSLFINARIGMCETHTNHTKRLSHISSPRCGSRAHLSRGANSLICHEERMCRTSLCRGANPWMCAPHNQTRGAGSCPTGCHSDLKISSPFSSMYETTHHHPG